MSWVRLFHLITRHPDFIPVYIRMACIYIYLHVMAKRRGARRKMARRFPSCSCLGSPVEFIGLLDEAITRVSSPPLGRGQNQNLLGTKRPVSRSRTAATPPFREARKGGGRRVGRKKRKRGASVKARLAPVINYRPSERPVHAPVAFFNFSPRSSPPPLPNLFHPTICFSIIQFFNTRDDSSLRIVEINRLASIYIYIYRVNRLLQRYRRLLPAATKRFCESIVETILISNFFSCPPSIFLSIKKKKEKKRKEKERIFLEYLYKSDTYFALYRI